MSFLIIGRDGTDENALERRMSARDAHMEYMKENIQKGAMIIGAALLDDDQKMIGSVIMTDHKTKEELKAWLDAEPYVLQNVWQDLHIQECKVAPSFAHLLPNLPSA